MEAEILSIGTELLLGQITDTNAQYLAEQLADMGIDVHWISQVGDNQGRLVEVLQRAWNRSELIVASGGLGPTDDDLTREAIAELLGEEMEVDPDLEAKLRDFFAQRRIPMTASNRKQAALVSSARPLPNPIGTAPGWWVERDGRVLVAMPGVPHEMRRMWECEAVPRLRQRSRTGVILSRNLKTMGLGESGVEETIRSLLTSTNPTVATYAKPDGVHVRITAKAGSIEEAKVMIADVEERARALLGTYIYGVDNESLAEVVGRLLLERSWTMGTMESCTGGLLANTITDTPGSSAYFRGGLIAYINELKVAWGVDQRIIAEHGAVSEETAVAMAQAVRGVLGCDVGLGVTGVAGPDTLEGKPAGTVYIAADCVGNVRTLSGTFVTTRVEVKRFSVVRALNLVRRMLMDI
ncbi:MAG: competence/damage-inducible protein A [Chloroflexi bacterium]|nr:competence/damage-inducible protein A [Chloroflexota bacterium]